MSRRKSRQQAVARSAALAYSGEGAPVLLAKGEHDVPIVQDDPLTELLCQIPLGEEIPRELYVAVAEVLAYVYRLRDQIDDRA